MNKKIVFLLVLVFAVFIYTAFSIYTGLGLSHGSNHSASKVNEAITLTFWDENAGPDRTPYLLELFKRFEQANPNIKVEYVGIPSASNKQKYDVAIASDNMPDIGGVNGIWVSDFVAKNALLSLDSYFSHWSDKDKIAKNLIENNRNLVPDRKLYELPNTMYLDVFWYRSDWLKEAGLKPPATWEDFFTDVKKLTNTTKNRYGYSIRGGNGSINQLTAEMYSYTGITNYFDKDGKSTVDDPNNIAFLKKYIALYTKYTPISDITQAYKDMVATFDNGTAAIIHHNFGSYQNHAQSIGEGNFQSVILPKAENGKRVIAPVINGYGIFKSTKHPNEAWQLLAFLLSSESQTYWNQNIGQMPTHADSLHSDYMTHTPYIQEGSKVLADKDTVILDVPLYLPEYNKISMQQLEPNFQKVMSGDMTPEAFLHNWAAVITKAKADYDKNMKE